MKKVLSVAICVMTVICMSVNILAAEMMQKGSRGDDVRRMQESLITLGYLDSDADGIFGPKTEAAVLAFQKDNGLDATGIVGEGTGNALKNIAAGQEVAAEIDYAVTFPSWNPESASLKELVEFVSDCTDESGDGYLYPEDRIATFDMDGTILCEKAPVYFDYCLTMYRVLDDPAGARPRIHGRRDLLSGRDYQRRSCRVGICRHDSGPVPLLRAGIRRKCGCGGI